MLFAVPSYTLFKQNVDTKKRVFRKMTMSPRGLKTVSSYQVVGGTGEASLGEDFEKG